MAGRSSDSLYKSNGLTHNNYSFILRAIRAEEGTGLGC